MDEDRKTPEQKFSGEEFQICTTNYRTWGCLVIVLEAPFQGGATWLTKREPKKDWSIYWTLSIPRRVSGSSIKHQNWECFPPVTCDI